MSNCTLNWGQIFFINLSWWPTAILVSSWVVARFIWLPMIKKYENVRLPPPPYEDLYPIEEDDKKLVSDKTDRENSFIIEKTPLGNIVMKYSIKNEGFEYWADKVILYKYLETVARKYVKSFHCVNLYINREEMREKRKTQLIKRKKQEEEDKKNKKKEEFVLKKSQKQQPAKQNLDFSTFKRLFSSSS